MVVKKNKIKLSFCKGSDNFSEKEVDHTMI